MPQDSKSSRSLVIASVMTSMFTISFWAMLLISLTIVILAPMVPPAEIRQAVEVPAE